MLQVHTRCLEAPVPAFMSVLLQHRGGISQDMCCMTHRGTEVRCWLGVTTTICKTGMKCTGEPKFLKHMDDGLPSHHGPVVHLPCTSVGRESEVTSFLLAEPACLLRSSVYVIRVSDLVPKV